jgi:hypothetical protein
MNFAVSLVESLSYADAFNREFDSPEKVIIGGLPVEHIAPSIKKTDESSQSSEIVGGYNEGDNKGGPFANKVVPVGLALIQTGKYPDVEYEDHFHPGSYREVVPDSLYDTLIGAVMPSKRSNSSRLPKHVSIHNSRRISKKIHK